MEEKDSWKIFETTGSVRDYLSYRQEFEQRNESDGPYESGRTNSAGYDSSERAAR